MGEDKFEEEKFMKALVNLKDTQESIQGFSGWCMKNRKSAYKMARCWTKVIKKVRVEQKLVLFYLVNDIVQHASKKMYTELLDKFRGAIKEAMPHLKEEKIAYKVQRCLAIWDERVVFDSEYIKELTALIDMTPVKEDQEIIENFQSTELCKQVKIMKALEDDADYKLKTLKENDNELKDIDAIKTKLKDKSCGDEYVNQFEDGTRRMEAYIKAMEREVTKRKQVIELLTQGKKYYDSLYGEAEIVATAYANFGNRVKKVHNKLEEKLPTLNIPAAPPPPGIGGVGGESPVPSPDYDAPSPQAEDEMELKLPDDDEPGTPDYPPPSNYQPPSSGNLNARLSAMDPSAFAADMSTTPSPEPRKDYHRSASHDHRDRGRDRDRSRDRSRERNRDRSRERHRERDRSRDNDRSSRSRDREDRERDIKREAMTIPRNNISDFLTKIAHGERLDLQGYRNEENGDSKRRRISDSDIDGFPLLDSVPDLFSRLSSVPDLFSNKSSVPEYPPPPKLSQDWDQGYKENLYPQVDEEEEVQIVENQALERLRKAASKNTPGGSNLISLTGSPVVRDSGLVGKSRNPDDMDLSDDEEGEIRDAQLENSWNQSFTGDRESTTPPIPFPGGTRPFQAGIPVPGPNSFKPADTVTVPPPPFSVPPPLTNHKGGWINSFKGGDSSALHSFPPPSFNSEPVRKTLINQPPNLADSYNSNSSNNSLVTPQAPPFSANNSFRDEELNSGMGDDSLNPFSDQDYMDPGFENEFPNTGSSFNQVQGYDSNPGFQAETNQDMLNSDFNSFRGNRGGFSAPVESPRGGFRGHGGGVGLERTNSSPEKMFWGDRGRGSPRGGGYGRAGMNNDRGGVNLGPGGGMNNGGSGINNDAVTMNRGGGFSSDRGRGRGDHNRGGGFDRGSGGFNRGGGGFERGSGGFNRGGGGFERSRGGFDQGGGGFDRGSGGFDRGGGGFNRGSGGFDRGRGSFNRGGFGGHTPEGGVGRGGMERGRRPWRGGRGSW